MEEETPREVLEEYGIEEVIDRYIMDGEAGDLLKAEFEKMKEFQEKAKERLSYLLLNDCDEDKTFDVIAELLGSIPESLSKE